MTMKRAKTILLGALGAGLLFLCGCGTTHQAGDGWQDDWWPNSPTNVIGVAPAGR
jgi:hypothetical protein